MCGPLIRRSRILAASALGLTLIVGCDTKEPSPAGTPSAEADTDPPGLVVFKRKKCTLCHTTPQTGSAPDKLAGPDLGKVGDDPAHTREWLIGYIRDPQAQDPLSKMPKFEGKLSEDDLSKLADFLLTLK